MRTSWRRPKMGHAANVNSDDSNEREIGQSMQLPNARYCAMFALNKYIAQDVIQVIQMNETSPTHHGSDPKFRLRTTALNGLLPLVHLAASDTLGSNPTSDAAQHRTLVTRHSSRRRPEAAIRPPLRRCSAASQTCVTW